MKVSLDPTLLTIVFGRWQRTIILWRGSQVIRAEQLEMRLKCQTSGPARKKINPQEYNPSKLKRIPVVVDVVVVMWG